MDIQTNFRQLFDYDTSVVLGLLNAVDESVWIADTVRQINFTQHEKTNSIIYVWSDHFDSLYENVQVKIPNSGDELTKEVWKIAERIRVSYGENSKIVKLMLAKLPAGSNIEHHADIKNLCIIHRNHLPIKTNEKCIFTIDGVDNNFVQGKVIEINNQKLHSVVNDGDTDRVHLICDILEEGTIENIDNFVIPTYPWWKND